jgi:S1-C subfamily serine protease
MKRNFLWATPALAAVLWLGGSAVSASAQSIDAATDTAAGAASDAGSAAGSTDASSSTDDAASTSDSATSSGNTSTDVGASAGATTSAAGADAAATSDGQSSISGDASISADAQTSTPPAPAQPASADVNANVGASTNATTQPENQTPGSISADAATASNADIDASLQRNANLQAGADVGAQQNLQSGLQFGQATDRGLAINTIARDHFFYNSGLRQGDVLMSYAGRPIRSQADFNRWAIYQPGQRVPVVVLRDGRPQTIHVVYQQQRGLEHQAGYAPAHGGAYLGVTFDAQNPQQAVVRTVTPGSPAERAGIQPGDAIVAVNGNQVGGSQDVIRVVSSMQPGEPIDVAISRQVVLGNRPGVAQAAYSPDVRIQGSVPQQPAPPVATAPGPAVAGSAAVTTDDYAGSVDADAAVVPGSGRYDNTPARAGDADRDGRLLDGDGRVGPAEGRAVLPRRRN